MEKKNFLFVSLTGLISDIAWQVSKEGHEVRYFIGDKKERDIGDSFVAKSKDWEKDVDCQFFLDLADGNDPKLKTRSGFQIGVRIVVPPFPFDDDETFDSFSKDSVIVFKKPPQDEIHVEDVKQVNGQWLVAGTSGVILVVIGMGPTMRQAQSQVYSRIKNVLIPNMYYRTDIGDRWVEDTDRLHTWGYLR